MTQELVIQRSAIVGKEAPEVYQTILLANRQLAGVFVCNYATPPSLQQRVQMTTYEMQIIEAAIEIRAANQLPFWEAVFCASIRSGDCRDTLIDAALFHNGMGDVSAYDRRDVEAGILGKVAGKGARNVGLSSQTILSYGEVRHLMLLDFHCEISDVNMDVIHRVCQRLMPKGFVILDSGDSYHACSLDVVTNDERVKALGKALLLAPIVDTTYVAHQLRQDASSIRISKGGKCNKAPTAIDAYIPQGGAP